MRGIKRVVKHTVRAELDDGRIVDVIIPFKGEAATRQAEVDAAVREGLRRWGERPQPCRREPAADPQHAHFYLSCLDPAFAAIVLDAWREQHSQ